MGARHRDYATEEEYLARERVSDVKHEYVNGEIVAMSGGTSAHSLIGVNVCRALGNRLAGKPCIVFNGDLRVKVNQTGLYTYPDASVVCSKPEYDGKDSRTLLNPLVIVEVLSESTEAYDRGAKFAHYRNLTSLSEYVLVSQSERRVEHFRRTDSGQWILTDYQNESAVALPALGCEVPLAEIFEKVELLARPETGPEEETGRLLRR